MTALPMPSTPGPPDPHMLAQTTFRGTGIQRVIDRLNELLADGAVAEARLLAELAPLVDHRDAGTVWMDYFGWRRWRYNAPDPDAPDSEEVFRTGVGRPASETQTDRYNDGKQLLIVNRILGRLRAYECVTATGQPYGDRRGHKLGHPFWRLRPAAAPTAALAPPVSAPLQPWVPEAAFMATTARIRKLDGAPLEQGQLLRRQRDQLLQAKHELPDQRVPDFDEHVAAQFSFIRQRAYQLIDLARVIEVVSTMVDTGKASLPQNERQARALVPLLSQPDDLRRVWQIAVDTAPVRADGSPIITAKHIKAVVDRVIGGPMAPVVEPASFALAPVLAAIAAGHCDAHLDALIAAAQDRKAALAPGPALVANA